MKVALVHDHLPSSQNGGAERVLRIMHEIFPDAPIYTLVYDEREFGEIFHPSTIRPSILRHVPFNQRMYQWLLPLMPLATELYDLSEFDVVISSSSAFSKGVILKPHTLHICYCHTPTRYLWTDTHSYVRELKRGGGIMRHVLPPLLARLRHWDRLAADRVDFFIANSHAVSQRIKKYYRRESVVIHPSVDIDAFSISEKQKQYFLAGGRMVPYKRFDLIVDAFNHLGFPLKIFGNGPEYGLLKKRAKKNIEFLGTVTDEIRSKLYSEARAFINPQEEDFGLTALESMAAGRPVIAYAAGGALETVIDGETGIFFTEQDYAALISALLRFNERNFNPHRIREHAATFHTDRFKKEFTSFVQAVYRNRSGGDVAVRQTDVRIDEIYSSMMSGAGERQDHEAKSNNRIP